MTIVGLDDKARPVRDSAAISRQIVSSALWAAWGDALGYITELTDPDGLQHRAGVRRVETTIPWKRTIGGKFGARVELPAGCYSDDTQLRLATCRAIRSDGEFDVEAFASIELPAFLAYALGAGRGTKAAASALSRPGVTWSTNMFSTPHARYATSGGNGAAMRIQPHVWAARDVRDVLLLLRDVVRNTVVTHGHPVGILGACWHALDLASTLMAGRPKQAWAHHFQVLSHLPDIIRADEDLATQWVPLWEEHTGTNLEDAFTRVLNDLHGLARALPPTDARDAPAQYETVLEACGGRAESTRGSGMGTALIASWLALAFRDAPRQGLTLAVNALGSDTDTIATMAGALLGAGTQDPIPGPLLDAEYVTYEALRLAAIADGQVTMPNFGYPDLLHVTMPKAAVDLVGVLDDELVLTALGWLRPIAAPVPSTGGSILQWTQRHLSTSSSSPAQDSAEPAPAPDLLLLLEVGQGVE